MGASVHPCIVLDGKTFVFLTGPAADNIADAGLSGRLLLFGFGLVKLFKHPLEFRFQLISFTFLHQ